MDLQALVGPPAIRPVPDPLAVLSLDNQQYINITICLLRYFELRLHFDVTTLNAFLRIIIGIEK